MHPNPVIYLDYAATSPVDPRVMAKMQACLGVDGLFANPASLHSQGVAARAAVEAARGDIAAVLRAEPSEILFTSGATESCNLAIKGAAQLYASRGRHLITLQTEHTAVLDTCEALERQGFAITRLAPEPDGRLDLKALAEAIRPDTVMVSLLHVNNETGVIQEVSAIASLTASRKILLHLDAAQSIGKVRLDVTKVPVDLVSLSAHKCNGPKGIGALYVRKRPRVRVAAQIHGGGQEQGQRSGTLPTHQIVGMAEAYSLADAGLEADNQRITQLRNQFLKALSGTDVIVHGHPEHVVPHILNLRFPGTPAKRLLEHCPTLALSTGSACQGKSTEPSHVLRAMGLTREEAKEAIRVSFGRFTTSDEVVLAAERLLSALQKH